MNIQNPTSEPYLRFKDEVAIMSQLSGQRGLLPLVASNIPAKPTSKDLTWLAMPVAITIDVALGDNASLEQVVAAIARIADTLATLAEEGVSHRDIKPGNLYRYEEDWVVGDFGLVSYPGKAALTKPGQKLGPMYFLAPEMLQNPSNADGRASDVYSLAKTLWVLAADQKYPPPGEQRVDIKQINLSEYVAHPRISQMDHLIERATNFDPKVRPSMHEVAAELELWGKPVEHDATKPDDYGDIRQRLRDELEPFRREEQYQAKWSKDMLATVEALRPQLTQVHEILQPATEFESRITNSGSEVVRVLTQGRPTKGHVGSLEIETFVRGEGNSIALHSGFVVDVLEDPDQRNGNDFNRISQFSEFLRPNVSIGIGRVPREALSLRA